MAPITGTTANTNINQGTAGATITQGQPLYMDATASNQLKPAQCTTLAAAACVGVALNAASAGQPVQYAQGGDVTYGSGLTKGTVYAVSATAGAIAPVADLVSTNYPTILGVATAAGTLRMGSGPLAAGVQI